MAWIYVDNTTTVTVTGLSDQAGNAMESATVEVTVRDENGDEVNGETWPVTLSDDGGGDYSGELSSDLDLSVGETYEITVIATKSNVTATWVERAPAVERTF